MSWTPSTSFYLPTRAASAAAAPANKLKFSMIRAMYDQSTGGLSLSDYYRDGDVVTDTTYVDSSTYNATNTAHEIPTSGNFRMSKFRGAAKEYRESFDADTVYDEESYNLAASQGRKKIKRYLNNGTLYASGTTTDSGRAAKGSPALTITTADAANWVIIVHNKGTIYGGGGAGGGGSSGGDGGTAGAEGVGGDDAYSLANTGSGNNYNGRYSQRLDHYGPSYGSPLYPSSATAGGAGGGGSAGVDAEHGGHGGPCVKIICSETGQQSPIIYLYNETDCTLSPGGGGGGGSSGGGGGGGSGGGGGGGFGSEGYFLTFTAPPPPPPPPPPSSDPRLKDTINKIGTYNGLNVYEWVWNDIATTIYGLRGREIGFLTTELDPEYIGKDHHGYGYIKNGTMISEALKEVRVTMTK